MPKGFPEEIRPEAPPHDAFHREEIQMLLVRLAFLPSLQQKEACDTAPAKGRAAQAAEAAASSAAGSAAASAAAASATATTAAAAAASGVVAE